MHVVAVEFVRGFQQCYFELFKRLGEAFENDEIVVDDDVYEAQ